MTVYSLGQTEYHSYLLKNIFSYSNIYNIPWHHSQHGVPVIGAPEWKLVILRKLQAKEPVKRSSMSLKTNKTTQGRQADKVVEPGKYMCLL